MAEPFRDFIAAGVDKGPTAQRIWQDLREEYGYAHAYPSVMRFVAKLRRPAMVDVTARRTDQRGSETRPHAETCIGLGLARAQKLAAF